MGELLPLEGLVQLSVSFGQPVLCASQIAESIERREVGDPRQNRVAMGIVADTACRNGP